MKFHDLLLFIFIPQNDDKMDLWMECSLKISELYSIQIT